MDDPEVTAPDRPGRDLLQRIALSGAQVTQLAQLAQSVASLAGQDLTAPAAPGGSGPGSNGGGPSDQFNPLTPINVFQPPGIGDPVITPFQSPAPPPLLTEPPPPPPPPPAIIITALGLTLNAGISILNASEAPNGFTVNGTTSGIGNGQAITITLVNNSSNQVVKDVNGDGDGQRLVAECRPG